MSFLSLLLEADNQWHCLPWDTMSAKSLHTFKNWLERWQENPLFVTKLLPLVQKYLIGKTLEAGKAIQCT